MWKNTVKPAVPLPAARPSVQDSAPPSPLTNFVPRPIKKRSKLLEGCLFNVQWSTHDTRDSFFAYIRTINDLGGINIKDQTDPRITHYIVVLPHRFPLSKKQFHTWEVAGDWKWQYVIREPAKWYTESENGFDVERNWKEGRTRMVVGREWLKEVIVGQLDPWSALGQGQGLASNSVGVEKGEVIEQEQGRWEICLKSDGRAPRRDGDIKGQNAVRSDSVKTGIDPRRPLLSTLPTEREVSPEPSYLFTPLPSADADIDTDEMDSAAHDEGEVQALFPDKITDPTTNTLFNSYFTPPPSATAQPYTYPYDRSVLFTPPPSKSPDLTHAHISPKYELVPLFSIDDPFGYKSIRARAEVIPVDVLDYGSPAVPSRQLDVDLDVGEKGLGIVFEALTHSSSACNESPPPGQSNRQTQGEPAAAPSTPTPVFTRPGQGLVHYQASPSYTITRRICVGGIKRPRTDDSDNVIPPLIKRKSLPVPVATSRGRSESGSPLSSVPSDAASPDHNESEDDDEDESEDEDEHGTMATSPVSEIDMDVDTDSDAGLDSSCKTGNEGVQSSGDGDEMNLHEAMLECDIIWTMADMMIEEL